MLRYGQKHTILVSNLEGGVWCVKQGSFDSCIFLSVQMSIKKIRYFLKKCFLLFHFCTL